jgi:hypothetical protein
MDLDKFKARSLELVLSEFKNIENIDISNNITIESNDLSRILLEALKLKTLKQI